MGFLQYGGSADTIEIPDELLAYLKVVVATKLRRGESFLLSWKHPVGDSIGRSTIWLQPSIPLRLEFDSAESAPLDPEQLQRFANEANSSAGLTIDLVGYALSGRHELEAA